MTDLLARFDRELARLGLEPGPALVAVSGGPDSLALLDLVARSSITSEWRLGVVHVDHGIHPDSKAVRERVEAAGARYGLPVEVENLGLGAGTTETVARRERYRAFRRALGRFGARWVFVGHTEDDQIETVLMRFLRGSGVAGLVGIQPRRGSWIRPLLRFTHDELTLHAVRAGLPPWDDPANRDPANLRSWLRHDLLPAIQGRLPRVRRELLASRPDFEEEIAALDGLLEPLGLDPLAEPGGGSVAVESLEGYSSNVVRVLLRALGRRFDLALGRAEVDRLQVLLAQGHSGHTVNLGQGAIGELSFGRLRLFGRGTHLTPEAIDLVGVSGCAPFGSLTVSWASEAAPTEPLERASDVTWVADGSPVRVRLWRPGDVIRPLRGRGTRLVVRCMQEARVPRTLRPEWPVFESDGVVVWVPGVCRSDQRVPEPQSPATRIFCPRKLRL